VYVGNDPLNSVDPFGLFTLNNHVTITTNGAMNAGMSRSQAEHLGMLVANVDFIPGSQNPSNSFMHAMSRAGENRMTAQREFTNYVNKILSSGSIEGLALALHAIQDFYANGHRDVV